MRLLRDAPEAATLLILLDRDVRNASIAFQLFETSKASFLSRRNYIPEMMHHASCFVCAVRRVARLLETLSSKRPGLKPTVAKVVKIEWRKKKSFFDSFIDPRDAIEHIDGEVGGNTAVRFFTLMNDRFEVANGKSVTINREALTKTTESLDRIVDAILREYPAPAATPSP